MSGRLALSVLAGAALIAGCGSGSPAGVVKQFVQAVYDEDFERACSLLSRDARDPEALGGPCETELPGMVDPNPSVVKQIDEGNFEVTEDEDRAVVAIENDLGRFQVLKEDGEWRLSGPG